MQETLFFFFLTHFLLLPSSALIQERLRDYSRAFDLSRSEEVKVHRLAVTMALDGQPLERMEKLLAVAVGTSGRSVHAVVQDAVSRIISALRCSFHSFTSILSHAIQLFISRAISFKPFLPHLRLFPQTLDLITSFAFVLPLFSLSLALSGLFPY